MYMFVINIFLSIQNNSYTYHNHILYFFSDWDLTRSNSAEETADLNAAQLEDLQDNESVAHKIKGLPEMTFAITDGIEYMVSVAERLYKYVLFIYLFDASLVQKTSIMLKS